MRSASSALLACQPLPQPVGKIGTDGIGEISRRRLTQPAQQAFVEELLQSPRRVPLHSQQCRGEQRPGCADPAAASRERLRRSTANTASAMNARSAWPSSGGCGSSRTGPGPPVRRSEHAGQRAAGMRDDRARDPHRETRVTMPSARPPSSTSTMRTGRYPELGGEPDLRDVSRAFLAADHLHRFEAAGRVASRSRPFGLYVWCDMPRASAIGKLTGSPLREVGEREQERESVCVFAAPARSAFPLVAPRDGFGAPVEPHALRVAAAALVGELARPGSEARARLCSRAWRGRGAGTFPGLSRSR